MRGFMSGSFKGSFLELFWGGFFRGFGVTGFAVQRGLEIEDFGVLSLGFTLWNL